MKSPHKTTSNILQAASWGFVLLLLWFAFRDVSWPAVQDVLGRLSLGRIAVLAIINSGLVLLMAARWWLILRTQGHQVSFLEATGYRLFAFGISYLTPGPHLGGEPMQVVLLRKRNGVSLESAAASVALDKILELSANFAFLAFGLTVLLNGGLVAFQGGFWALAGAVLFLAGPLVYLGLVAQGKHPFRRLAGKIRFQGRPFLPEKFIQAAGRSENEIGAFVRRNPAAFLQAVLLSGLVLVALVFEYAVLLYYLELRLDLWQIVSLITGARLAILLPFPAGLGALEAALVLVTQALGESAAVGAGLSLFIRMRDLSFSLLGLGLGGNWMSSREAIARDETNQSVGQGS